MESELPADWEPISLQQTSEKDELAQVRLQNASATLSSIDRDKPDVTADVYYKAGIVAQMALTSFLLHRGFDDHWRSEEHTSELQSLMRISYAVFCLNNKKTTKKYTLIVIE